MTQDITSHRLPGLGSREMTRGGERQVRRLPQTVITAKGARCVSS